MRSISPQFLEEIICCLQRLGLLTAEEAGRAQEASSLPRQVWEVGDILAGKGSYSSQALQTFTETTNSQLFLPITVCGRQLLSDTVRGVSTHTLAGGVAGAPQDMLRAGQPWQQQGECLCQ